MNDELKNFVELVIKDNVSPNDTTKEHMEKSFSDYTKQTARNIVNSIRRSYVVEAALTEMLGSDAKVKLNGDDLYVNGKLVGYINNDLNNLDAGINFENADRTFSKEFNTLEELYAYIHRTFNEAKEQDEKNKLTDRDEDCLDEVKNKSKKLKDKLAKPKE